MVIGPNGTGKSAIVCSIIVGLAGDVTLTGRANTITSLVQRGCDWASTEIELFNDDGRNHVIQRKIIITSRDEARQEHRTEWSLNGKQVPKKTIQKLIEELNIKVDNLCQFLPQDSVASFVKMNPSELLLNTLKAAGDNQLVEYLDKLIQLTSEISSKTILLEGLKKESAQNEVNVQRLGTEVQELQAREELVKKKAICSLKIIYVKYTEALADYDKAKEEFNNKETELRQHQNCAAPVQAKIQFYKNQEAEFREKSRSNLEESKRAKDLMRRGTDSLEERKMKIQEEHAKFKAMEDQEEQRTQQYNLKNQELESLKCRLDEIQDVDYSEEIANLKAQASELQRLLLSKNDEKNSLSQESRRLVMQIEDKQNKKNELLSVRDKRLNFVIQRRRDYQRVCDWLAKNRDSFQKEVLLPIFCDLNIKDLAFADVVEYSINEQDLYAFICQTDEDLKIFTKQAHDILNARINVILQPDKTLEEFERDVAQRGQDLYRGMDFAGFLKDMVEAPEPIMRYLCGQYNFHKVPVFNNLREVEMKRMMESCPKFFTKKTFYNIQRSKYDQEKTVFNEKIREAQILKNCSFNKNQLEELDKSIDSLQQMKREMDSRIQSILQEIAEHQRKIADLNQKCRDLMNKQNEKDRVKMQIDLCSRKLEELKSDRIDIATERTKLQDSIRNIDQKSIDDLERLNKIVNTYALIRQKHLLNTMCATLSRNNYRAAENKYKEVQKKAEELEKHIQEEKERLKTLKNRALRSKEDATENIPNFNGGKLDKRTKEKFARIEHETVEALERYQEELKARIQGMQGVVGNQLLSEFHRQNRELADNRRQISELEAAVVSLTAEQSEIKNQFLSQLDGVIKVIDEHYRDFMRKLNYDGRVELARDPANIDDFSKYGINIMVKYRDDEQLIPLSSTRQSGGERSVATMIYMLALQTKTSVPFRVVDEINQGMDKDNERKVFELLVRTADESSSQYFLVSPKLLSGLNYGDQMQIHIVFNGPRLNFSFDDLKSSDGDEAYGSESPSSSDDEEMVVVPKRRRK
jgi:chromosome segregation ATPase